MIIYQLIPATGAASHHLHLNQVIKIMNEHCRLHNRTLVQLPTLPSPSYGYDTLIYEAQDEKGEVLEYIPDGKHTIYTHAFVVNQTDVDEENPDDLSELPTNIHLDI